MLGGSDVKRELSCEESSDVMGDQSTISDIIGNENYLQCLLGHCPTLPSHIFTKQTSPYPWTHTVPVICLYTTVCLYFIINVVAKIPFALEALYPAGLHHENM